jgi:hypothetical protein
VKTNVYSPFIAMAIAQAEQEGSHGPFWLLGGWYEVVGPGIPRSIHATFCEVLQTVFLRGRPGATYAVLERGPADELFRPVRRAVAWYERTGAIVTMPAVMQQREGRVLP